MPPDRSLNIAVIIVLASVAAVTQIVALMGGRRMATAGDFFRWYQRSTVLRALTMMGWLWLGWHFFVRGDW